VSREKRLAAVLLLNLLLVAALVITGLAAHSLGVLAAGGDYLADASAIGVSLFAIWLSRTPRPGHPGGYPNATNIAALVNAGWLLILNVLIIVAAIRRLVSGAPHVEGLPVLIISAIAAAVMLTGALILGRRRRRRRSRGQRRSHPHRRRLVLAGPRGCPGHRCGRRLPRPAPEPQGRHRDQDSQAPRSPTGQPGIEPCSHLACGSSRTPVGGPATCGAAGPRRSRPARRRAGPEPAGAAAGSVRAAGSHLERGPQPGGDASAVAFQSELVLPRGHVLAGTGPAEARSW
jgi:hypothetical protein